MAELLDHDFDGIQELDNPAPPWLMGILYASIVFAIGYCLYYPSFWFWPGLSGWSSSDQYHQQMDVAKTTYAEFETKPTNVALKPDDEAVIEVGKTVFATRCMPCHGKDGEGKIGPSFLDAEWRYGSEDADIVESVAKGRPKGMPPWGKTLKAEEVEAVSSYVRRLNNEALKSS